MLSLLKGFDFVVKEFRNPKSWAPGGGAPDAVPAGTNVNLKSWKPGGHQPDPVPTLSASNVSVGTWHPGHYAPDPVRAGSYG